MNKPEISFEKMNELFTALTMNIPTQSIILIKFKTHPWNHTLIHSKKLQKKEESSALI